MNFKIKDTINNINVYKPGEGNIFADNIIKLSANENPFGCSDNAKAAFIDMQNYLNRYPQGGSKDLKNAIAKKFDINSNNIVCGCGSDEILSLLITAFTKENDEIIHTEHGFLMYKFYALINGVKPVAAGETNLKADINKILNKVSNKTRIVFIANPNNPTGSYLTFDELKELRQQLSDDIILVIDGAYSEYVINKDYEDGFELVKQFDNIVATRTFSKIHGLAALRVGYCYSSKKICNILNKVVSPFNVSLPAQQSAIAALESDGFCNKSRMHNDKWMKIFSQEFSKLNAEMVHSVANFFLIKSSINKLKKFEDLLKKNNIIIRNIKAYGLENYLRITIGLDDENEEFLKLSREFWL